MTVKINGDNSFAKPAITGSDDDSGVRVNGLDTQIIRGSVERAAFDGNGIRIIKNAESFSGFQRTGAAATNDYIGVVNWQAQNSAGNNVEYAKVNTQILDNTAGSENSNLYMQSRRDGTLLTSLECHNGITTQPYYPYCIGAQSGQGWTNLNQASGNPRNVGLLAANSGNFHRNSNTDVFIAGLALGSGGYPVIHVKYAGIYRIDMQLYQRNLAHNRVYVQRNQSQVVTMAELSQQTEDMTSHYSGMVGCSAMDYFNFRVEYNSVNADLYWSGDHTQVTITKVG